MTREATPTPEPPQGSHKRNLSTKAKEADIYVYKKARIAKATTLIEQADPVQQKSAKSKGVPTKKPTKVILTDDDDYNEVSSQSSGGIPLQTNEPGGDVADDEQPDVNTQETAEMAEEERSTVVEIIFKKKH